MQPLRLQNVYTRVISIVASGGLTGNCTVRRHESHSGVSRTVTDDGDADYDQDVDVQLGAVEIPRFQH